MAKISQVSTRERRDRDRCARQRRILQAAENVFLEKRYARSTMLDIAAEAGVSVGTLYNHFPSKMLLYREVARRVGEDLVRATRRILKTDDPPHKSLEALATLRLKNAQRHDLFLSLFIEGRQVVLDADLAGVAGKLRPLYLPYVQMLQDFLRTHMQAGHFRAAPTRSLAVGMEGMLSAMCAEAIGTQTSGQDTEHAAEVAASLMAVLRGGSAGEPQPTDSQDRVCLSRFDYNRLRELVVVARSFGVKGKLTHLDRLEHRLAEASVVPPQEVPRHLVTMNSRVLLEHRPNGNRLVRRLVFPADGSKSSENVSVLHPLGAALLGAVVGGTIAPEDGQKRRAYRIVTLLYQPETAGDYHL